MAFCHVRLAIFQNKNIKSLKMNISHQAKTQFLSPKHSGIFLKSTSKEVKS